MICHALNIQLESSMRKTLGILSKILFIFSLVSTGFLLGQEPPQQRQANSEEIQNYLKDWLKSPVKYIITKEEEQDYKLKLKIREKNPDELFRYIEYFWRRRDPNPQTVNNEFRTEFFNRVGHCEKFYKIGKRAGWDSHRGHVFIVFGPPQETQKAMSAETWTYYSLPSDKAPNNLSVQFRDIRGNNDYRVAGTMYPGKDDGEAYMDATGQRALSGSMPRDVIEILKDLIELNIADPRLKLEDIPAPTQPKGESPPPRPRARRGRTEEPLKEAPFDLQSLFFQSEESDVEMMLGFDIPYKNIGFKEKDGQIAANLTITSTLIDGNKNEVDSFTKDLQLILKSQESEDFENLSLSFWHSLHAAPGKYRLELKAEDKNARQQKELNGNIEIPNLRGEALLITTIIPASEIAPAPEQPEYLIPLGSIVLFGQVIRPNITAVFSKDSELCLFFQVLNLQISPETSAPDFEINCYIFRNEKIFKPIALRENNYSSLIPGELVSQLKIPLSDFPADDYVVIVQAKDKISKTETAKKLNIKVVE